MSIPSKLTAWLTINRACNLRCGWCYAKGTAFSQHDTMSTKTAERSLDLLSDLGNQQPRGRAPGYACGGMSLE
jgi:sulfatase maturation enzyme AslB (radical SAM superfamily)